MSERSDIDARYNQHLTNGYTSAQAYDMAMSELGGKSGYFVVGSDGEIETTSAWEANEAAIKKYQAEYEAFLETGNTDTTNTANAKTNSTVDWQDEVAFERTYGRKPTTAKDYALIGKTQPMPPATSNTTIADNSTATGGGYTDTKTNYVSTDTPESLTFKAKANTLKEQKADLEAKLKAGGATRTFNDPDVKQLNAEIKATELAEERAQTHTTTQSTSYFDANGDEITESEYTVSHTANPATGAIENVQVGNPIKPVQLTQADADRLNAEALAEGGYAPRTLEDLQDEANDDAYLASLPTYNGIQFQNQQALDEYKANNVTGDLKTESDTITAVPDDEDELDTLLMQSEFDQENLDDEYASRPVPEPSVAELRGAVDKGDWRVRLRLAPQSDYLYNAQDPGILAPLAETDGIIFPYLPRIDTVHQARYSNYDLPHSNYRGYFYGGSHQERVIVSATFTAQDTKEANYMLAALHFLRSCTKMFYGQDAQRGTPPPLVFLSGLGDHQFNEHPCAVEIVNINLPNDVDYIEAGDISSQNVDFMSARGQTKAPSFSGSLSRLFGAGMTFGGTPAPTYRSENIYKAESKGTTRMPTKMEIAFNLLPIQTRDQVSNEYSLKDYASGSLLKKGFW